jgi:hypothetical protein
MLGTIRSHCAGSDMIRTIRSHSLRLRSPNRWQHHGRRDRKNGA